MQHESGAISGEQDFGQHGPKRTQRAAKPAGAPRCSSFRRKIASLGKQKQHAKPKASRNKSEKVFVVGENRKKLMAWGSSGLGVGSRAASKRYD